MRTGIVQSCHNASLYPRFAKEFIGETKVIRTRLKMNSRRTILTSAGRGGSRGLKFKRIEYAMSSITNYNGRC